MADLQRAEHHARIAEELLGRIKTDKAMGRGMDVKDGNTATVATAHATLAIFYAQAPAS